MSKTIAVNPDLVAARARAHFDFEHLTHLIDGGVLRTMERRRLTALLDSEPLFDMRDDIFMGRVELYTKALSRARRLKEIQSQLGLDPNSWKTLRLVSGFDDPTTLHELMFMPNIEALASREQQARWLPLCRDWRMIGCYAQTEIGHGSNVRAIETTATFDPVADEFILSTPTVTATKFWPGSMGRTANTAVVIARLITPDGKDQGIHNFLVPLRDPSSHELLPGVRTGDIGPKLVRSSAAVSLCSCTQNPFLIWHKIAFFCAPHYRVLIQWTTDSCVWMVSGCRGSTWLRALLM